MCNLWDVRTLRTQSIVGWKVLLLPNVGVHVRCYKRLYSWSRQDGLLVTQTFLFWKPPFVAEISVNENNLWGFLRARWSRPKRQRLKPDLYFCVRQLQRIYKEAPWLHQSSCKPSHKSNYTSGLWRYHRDHKNYDWSVWAWVFSTAIPLQT